jgi:hypothetical protein
MQEILKKDTAFPKLYQEGEHILKEMISLHKLYLVPIPNLDE